MKAYKIELLVIDFDQMGGEDIKHTIENTRYPNHCINPSVQSIQEADIGIWDDDHPLNKHDTASAEYARLFSEHSLSAQDEVLTDEQAWTIITEICGTQLTRVGSRKFQVVEINDMATAGEVARALLAAAPSPAVAMEPQKPTLIAYVATDLDGHYDVGTTPEKAKQRAGHGCDTVFPIYDIGDNTTPPALAGSQVQATGDTRVKEWERACREIIDRCVAPDMHRNAREMLDRAVTEALRTLP